MLARAHRITRTNLAVLDEWIAGRNDITYVRPASGTTALLRYDAPIGSHAFCTRLLEETGVLLTPRRRVRRRAHRAHRLRRRHRHPAHRPRPGRPLPRRRRRGGPSAARVAGLARAA
ncbi:hypothetical protein GCM10020295_02770 [Streptomyces cinereospinus]